MIVLPSGVGPVMHHVSPGLSPEYGSFNAPGSLAGGTARTSLQPSSYDLDVRPSRYQVRYFEFIHGALIPSIVPASPTVLGALNGRLYGVPVVELMIGFAFCQALRASRRVSTVPAECIGFVV